MVGPVAPQAATRTGTHTTHTRHAPARRPEAPTPPRPAPKRGAVRRCEVRCTQSTVVGRHEPDTISNRRDSREREKNLISITFVYTLRCIARGGSPRGRLAHSPHRQEPSRASPTVRVPPRADRHGAPPSPLTYTCTTTCARFTSSQRARCAHRTSLALPHCVSAPWIRAHPQPPRACASPRYVLRPLRERLEALAHRPYEGGEVVVGVELSDELVHPGHRRLA